MFKLKVYLDVKESDEDCWYNDSLEIPGELLDPCEDVAEEVHLFISNFLGHDEFAILSVFTNDIHWFDTRDNRIVASEWQEILI